MKRKFVVLVCALCFTSYVDCSVETRYEEKTSACDKKQEIDGFPLLRDDIRKLRKDIAKILSLNDGEAASQVHGAIFAIYAEVIDVLKDYRKESIKRIVEELLKILGELLDSINEQQVSGDQNSGGNCELEKRGSCSESSEEEDFSSDSDDLIETLKEKVQNFQASLQKFQTADCVPDDYDSVSTGFYSECATIIRALNLNADKNIWKLVKVSNLKDLLDRWLEENENF